MMSRKENGFEVGNGTWKVFVKNHKGDESTSPHCHKSEPV